MASLSILESRPHYMWIPWSTLVRKSHPLMAAVKVAKSGIATGANHGHVVKPRAVPTKPSHRKGVRILSPFTYWLRGSSVSARTSFRPSMSSLTGPIHPSLGEASGVLNPSLSLSHFSTMQRQTLISCDFVDSDQARQVHP